MSAPRYRSIADALRGEIAAGVYAPGAVLPPERALCARFEASRHTVREAMRLLLETGLVSRRQGSGTRVLGAKAFVQPLGGVDDLLQYARDARLLVKTTQMRALDAEEARRVEAPEGSEWLVADGVRRTHDGPLAVAKVYIAPPYAAIRSDLGSLTSALHARIEEVFGVAVARIEQKILAERMTLRAARALDAERGAPALRTLRRYYDASDRIIMMSDTLHTGNRFAYVMSYRRDANAEVIPIPSP